MRSKDSTADADDHGSLYDMIVNATGIEYEPGGEFPSPEEYKSALVRAFGKMRDEFDDLPEDIKDWVNEATTIFNANRREKDPELRVSLPDIEGLPEPPPPAARRSRVVVDDDEEEDTPPPAPVRGRSLRVAPDPVEEDEDDEEEDEEPAPPPPPARAQRRAPTPPPAPVAATSRRNRRDPDAGRYAKVMPHYLKDRDIEVPELQDKIAKTDGANYSETTLDRTLAACVAVVGWLERNGVNLDRLSK